MSSVPREPARKVPIAEAKGWMRANRTLMVRIAVGIVVLMAAAAVLALLLKDTMIELGTFFVTTFGVWGVGGAIVITDSIPLPTTHEPILFLGLTGGLTAWQVGAIASVASIVAGCVGYTAGFTLRRLGLTARFLGERAASAEAFVARYGLWGIGAAALTPIPFSMCTWSAGALGMNFPRFFVGCLFRIPKVAIYLGLIVAGWSLGGG